MQAAGERYRFQPTLRVSLDAAEFERAVVSALRELRDGRPAANQLRAALRLYRGDFLAGEKFGDWTLEWSDRLQRLQRDALRALGAHELKAQRFSDAADLFEQLVAADPLDEDAHRQLIICNLQRGTRSEALRVYQRLRERLQNELGTAPESATMALIQPLEAPTST